MKAKNIKEKVNKGKHEKLVRLMSILSPEEHQKFLNDIDLILCNLLDLEMNDLPWINPNKNDEKWEQIMDNLRLVIGKLEFESQMKKRTVH